MITAAHTIIYSDDAEKTRAFLRDTLGLKSVDAGDGWLIFKLPPAELACHPDATGGRHELYLMCDDINATVAELKQKGVEFTSEITNQGWGMLISLKVPHAGEMGLYQPRHPTAYDL